MGKFTPKNGGPDGTVDGFVVSSNHNGAILRNKSIPTNVKRPSNTPHRSSFNAAATRWSNIDTFNKTQWENHTLDGYSGYEAYQYFGNNRYLCGLDYPANVRPLIGALNWTASISNPVSGQLLVTANEGVFVDTANVVVYMSPPVVNGNQEPNQNEFRIVLNKRNPTSFMEDVRASYESIFGPLDEYQGFVIYVRITTITWRTGEVNVLSITSLLFQNV